MAAKRGDSLENGPAPGSNLGPLGHVQVTAAARPQAPSTCECGGFVFREAKTPDADQCHAGCIEKRMIPKIAEAIWQKDEALLARQPADKQSRDCDRKHDE